MYLGIDIGGSHISFNLVKDDKIIEVIHTEYLKLWHKTLEDENFLEDYLYNTLMIILSNEYMKRLYDRKENISKVSVCIPGIVDENKNSMIECTGNIIVGNLDFLNSIKERMLKGIHELENNMKSENIEEINDISFSEFVSNLDFTLKNDTKSAYDCEKHYGIIGNMKLEDCIFLAIGTGIGTVVRKDGKEIEEGYEQGRIEVIDDSYGDLANVELEKVASLKNIKEILRELEINKSLVEFLNSQEEKDIIIYDNIIRNEFSYQIRMLKRGIEKLEAIYDIHNIVIGGGYSELEETKVMDIVSNEFQNMKYNIYFAQYKNDAGIIGCGI